MSPCPKCKGTKWYSYDENHSTICNLCCQHEQGWWDLTRFHHGYREGEDNGCCLTGCGTMRRDLPKKL
jgi:hypothetical protein